MSKNYIKLLIPVLLFIQIAACVIMCIRPSKAAESAYAMLYEDGSLILQRGSTQDPSHGSLIASYANVESAGNVLWRENSAIIKHVFVNNPISPNTTYSWFANCVNLEDADLSLLNVSKVTSASKMFYGCSKLTSLDFTGKNFLNLKTADAMFAHCLKLQELDLRDFRAPKLENISDLFYDMPSLKKLNIQNFQLNANIARSTLIDIPSLEELTINSGISKDQIKGLWYLSNGKLWEDDTVSTVFFTLYHKNPALSTYQEKKLFISMNVYLDGKLYPAWNLPNISDTTYKWKILDENGNDVTLLNGKDYILAKGLDESSLLSLKEGNQYHLQSYFSYKSDYKVSLQGNLTFIPNEENDIVLTVDLYYQSVCSIKAKKTWKDSGLEDVRPDSLQFNLLKDGLLYDSKSVTALDKWTACWDQLPVYEPSPDGTNRKIVWIVEERIPLGYEKAEDSVQTEKKEDNSLYEDLTVYKYWEDDHNSRLSRGNLTLHLWKISGGNREEIDVRTVNCSNTKQSSQKILYWPSLPKKDTDGKAIRYEITEDSLPHYRSSIRVQNNFTGESIFLTNTYIESGSGSSSEDTNHKDLLIQKIWDDKNPSDRNPFTVTLYNVKENSIIESRTIQPVQISGQNSQDIIFRNIPIYDSSGQSILYSVRESIKAEGYLTYYSKDGQNFTPSYQGYDDNISNGYMDIKQSPDASAGQAVFYIKNSLPQTHRIKIMKKWKNQDTSECPNDLKLGLYGNLYDQGQLIASDVLIQELDWANVNTASYDTASAMSSSQVSPGSILYYEKGSNSSTILANVPNTFTYQGHVCMVEYTGIKENNAVGYVLSAASASKISPYNGFYTISGINDPLYGIREWDQQNDTGYNYFVLENKEDTPIQLKVLKKWIGKTPTDTSLQVTLMTARKEEYQEASSAILKGQSSELSLSAMNQWQNIWINLPRTHGGFALDRYKSSYMNLTEERIDYRVFEKDDQGNLICLPFNQTGGPYRINGEWYKVQYLQKTENSTSQSITIKNTPQIEIPYEKVWDDSDNADGSRKTALLHLIYEENGKKIHADNAVVTGNEKGKFYAPRYDASGEEINYHIIEEAMDGYESEISGDQKEGFLIINHHRANNINLSFEKIWEDEDDYEKIRPASVKITLYANEKKVQDLTLSKEHDWKYTLPNMPSTDANQKKILYTVIEEDIPGYESSIKGSALEGFVINNKHSLESRDTIWNLTNTPTTTSVQVKKVWDVSEHYDLSQAGIYVQLYKSLISENENARDVSKQAVGQPILLNEQNDWCHIWESLAKYDKERQILYSIEEVNQNGEIITPSGMIKTIHSEEENSYILTNQSTKVEISKEDSKGNLIEGALLQIYKKNEDNTEGPLIAQWDSSSKKAYYIEGILDAEEYYILHEEKAPDGYHLAEDLEFKVERSGTLQKITMVDEKMGFLPNTGANPRHYIWLFTTLLTIGLVLFSLILLEKSRKN